MKLSEAIVAAKCRKGKAAGITKRGAYWLAASIPIRSYGGDGIGNSAPSLTNTLELRHYRNGHSSAVVACHGWHQDPWKCVDDYKPVPELLDCTTVEQAIAVLRGVSTLYGHALGSYYEQKMTEALVRMGMAECEPSPDEARAKAGAAARWGKFDVACECGEWLGEPCQWTGRPSETVVVEWMPEHLRASHDAAGNRGAYPRNGAVRLRCEKSCAARMIEHDGDWCEIVR